MENVTIEVNDNKYSYAKEVLGREVTVFLYGDTRLDLITAIAEREFPGVPPEKLEISWSRNDESLLLQESTY